MLIERGKIAGADPTGDWFGRSIEAFPHELRKILEVQPGSLHLRSGVQPPPAPVSQDFSMSNAEFSGTERHALPLFVHQRSREISERTRMQAGKRTVHLKSSLCARTHEQLQILSARLRERAAEDSISSTHLRLGSRSVR